jgi:hypothetical protein
MNNFYVRVNIFRFILLLAVRVDVRQLRGLYLLIYLLFIILWIVIEWMERSFLFKPHWG